MDVEEAKARLANLQAEEAHMRRLLVELEAQKVGGCGRGWDRRAARGWLTGIVPDVWVGWLRGKHAAYWEWSG